MRKIIEIILDRNNKLIALCDDGSLWIKQEDWVEILGIPQDDDDYVAKGNLNNEY